MSALKSSLKRLFFLLAPQTATAVMSARARARSHQQVKVRDLAELDRRLRQEAGCRVLSGPFEGMLLTPGTYEEHIGPYLLGTYEMELNPWWEEVFRQSFDLIVDIGAGIGYYAVGFALRFPDAAVIAFETDWWARDVLREMAAGNGIGNLSVRKYCTPSWLQHNLRARTLIISDCEGYEGELFAGSAAAAFASATMVIELHEDVVPGVGSKMRARFGDTHEARMVPSRAEPVIPKVPVRGFNEREIRRVATEVRPRQDWLFLTPKPA